MMNQPIKVSVFCLAYNHEKYLRQCLEGFVMQKTTFPFEVLIHDDASTDGTADIIREYEEKYPDIIKPTYQKENQYSKGIKIIRTFLMDKAQGEYFAWCEGDDCWTDCNKLQKQVDFLDTHPDYSTCYHRVLCRNLRDNTTRYIPQITESREFLLDEIVKRGAVFQSSSFMIRSDLYKQKPSWFSAKGFGDITLYMYGAVCGKSFVLHDVMSVYNHGTVGSWTVNISQNKEQNLTHEKNMLEMLERVNARYKYQYDAALQYGIKRAKFNICILQGDIKEAKDKQYAEFYSKYKTEKRVYFVRKYLPFFSKLKKIIKRS